MYIILFYVTRDWWKLLCDAWFNRKIQHDVWLVPLFATLFYETDKLKEMYEV